MHKTLAAAIALLTGLVSAQAQTSSKNILHMYAAAMPVSPATPSQSPPRGDSVSRTCLTAQTRAVLAQMEGQFGPVKVVSTCRPGAVIAGSGKPSQHRYGKAVDVVPPPGQRASVIAWLRQHASGAVITYRSGHVHFDTGPWRVYSCGDCGPRNVRRTASASAPARLSEASASQSTPH
jgi:hypothetical protein